MVLFYLYDALQTTEFFSNFMSKIHFSSSVLETISIQC